jgi:hypothetical protein
MRYVILFYFLLFTGLFAYAQETDRDIQGLKGPVISARTDGYFLIQNGLDTEKGLPIPGINYHTLDSFNLEGFLIEAYWFQEDTVYRRTSREYRDGLELSKRTYLGQKLVEEVMQEWFDNGELSAQWKMNSQGDTARYMLNVLDTHDLISHSYEYSHGQLFEKISFDYDEYGNMTSSSSFDPEGNLILQIDFEYDSGHRMISMFSWSPVLDPGGWVIDTNQIWKESWTYADSLLQQHESIDYHLGERAISDFFYSTKNILYRKELRINGELSELQEWDPSNDLLSRHEFYGHGGLLTTSWTFDYELDEQGNWVHQRMIRDGTPERVIERKLIYK